MLQRAASNAYSWWRTSHIRTKQSKWVEGSMKDMDKKVQLMLAIIEEDADSFGKKAEMYYKRRPELINFVQEVYKGYRALAERYDHLSGELQKANSVIATIFPEQARFGMEDEDEDDEPSNASTAFNNASANLMPPTAQGTLDRKKTLQVPACTAGGSPMSKDKAEEVDTLQKGILVLQTEKEFVKSSFQSGLAKYWDMEKLITEMQAKVNCLRDASTASNVIEDQEARALMAATALKSCKNNISNLHEQHKKFTEEAGIETLKIKSICQKLENLKKEHGFSHISNDDFSISSDSKFSSLNQALMDEIYILDQQNLEVNIVTDRIKKKFEMNSESFISEIAEHIDQLVEKVIKLEGEVSSEAGRMQRLRIDNNELQKHLQEIEGQKGQLIGDSKSSTDILDLLEKDLVKVFNLERCFEEESNKLQEHLLEACYNLKNLSQRLLSDDQKIVDEPSMASCESKSSQDLIESLTNDEGISIEEKQVDSNNQPNNEEELSLPNWEELFQHKLEDRERLLLAEYTTILRHYKETKGKLTEAEEKNQSLMFESFSQIRDLKDAILMKDEEIHSLRENLNFLESCWNNDSDILFPEPDSAEKVTVERVLADDFSFPTSSNVNVETSNGTDFSTPPKTNIEVTTNIDELSFSTLLNVNEGVKTDAQTTEELTPKEKSAEQVELAVKKYEHASEKNFQIGTPMPLHIEGKNMSAMEEKFRSDVDKLLEENLEFWSRVTLLFERIQDYITTFEDVQGKLLKIDEIKKANSTSSDIEDEAGMTDLTSSYRQQLNELQAKLLEWIEENTALREELQIRFSSLCSIKEEMSRALKEREEGEEVQLTAHRTAKFQGEILSMVHENNRVADELQAGMDHVKSVQTDVNQTLAKFATSSGEGRAKGHKHRPFKYKAKLPLRSILFNATQKSSIFPCMSPPGQKKTITAED